MIIEGLEVTSLFLSDHISNYLSLNGQMPSDKAALLRSLDRALDDLYRDPSLAEDYRYKKSLRHL
jgi:hypothetical protein